MAHYNSTASTNAYLNFLESPDGEFQKEVLLSAINRYLPNDSSLSVLDAGCGHGWVTAELARRYHSVIGIDFSGPLLAKARQLHPGLAFKLGDLEKNLPFGAASFDLVVTNMVVHTVTNQNRAFANLAQVLKPSGLLICTVVNPYYAKPAGKWKRTFLGKLLRRKPRLFINQYNLLIEKPRGFVWGGSVPSNFHPLAETLSNALAAGFSLVAFEELKSETDTKNFSLQYQLYRVPLLLLLVFKKSSK